MLSMDRSWRTSPERRAHRGAVLHFRSDPGASDSADSYEYWPDGLLIVSDGHVENVGPADELLRHSERRDRRPRARRRDAPARLHRYSHSLSAGATLSGSAGADLLDWLEHYTFPAERRFEYAAHARAVAEFFLDELARNGTTTAQVLGTVAQVRHGYFLSSGGGARPANDCGQVADGSPLPGISA